MMTASTTIVSDDYRPSYYDTIIAKQESSATTAKTPYLYA
jgi:hypothetical protein